MLSIAIKSVWAHKRRLVATTFSVVLGVAFLAGTLLLGDTLRANFDKLFAQADGTTDVVVRSATALGSGPGSARTSVDASLLPAVRNVPGVADAAGYIEGFGRLLDHNGKAIGGSGPPTTAANWISDPRLNAYRLVQGHAPRADNEVVINRGATKSGHLAIGAHHHTADSRAAAGAHRGHRDVRHRGRVRVGDVHRHDVARRADRTDPQSDATHPDHGQRGARA